MSRVVKVNQGDYIIQAKSGGNIVLDIGSTGLVTVTGNLNVLGSNTTVNTTNLSINDNLILLNSGETGAGITLGQSGFQIDRGTLPTASMLFDESVQHYDPYVSASINGTFVLETENERLSGLQLATLTTDGTTDLIFDMQGSSHVLRIANSINYDTHVIDDNDIPNKKFITNYVAATSGVADVSRIFYPLSGGPVDSRIDATSSSLDFSIFGSLRTRISAGGLAVDNILVSGDTIADTGVNNLILTAASNVVQVNSVFGLLDQTATQTSTTGQTKLYSMAAAGPGKTGLFVSNVNTTDELVSKNRAVLLSILL